MGHVSDNENPIGRQPTRIQSVTRAAALLEFVATDPAGPTAAEVAATVGVPLPAYHLLDTLVDAGFLAIDEEAFCEGVECIAAPVADGTLALGISTPVERCQVMKDELVSAVVSFAAKARSFAPLPVEKAS